MLTVLLALLVAFVLTLLVAGAESFLPVVVAVEAVRVGVLLADCLLILGLLCRLLLPTGPLVLVLRLAVQDDLGLPSDPANPRDGNLWALAGGWLQCLLRPRSLAPAVPLNTCTVVSGG